MFDYFISLGERCPIAASMEKYGLRSFSAPFDWLVTRNFNWVLQYLETDFSGFLLRENLEQYGEYPNYFREKQSDIWFLHENDSFEHHYEKIKNKYDRRIGKFLEKTRSKVCYLRSMRTEQDYEYIVQNAERIKNVIKRNNSDSEIVFLCDSDVVKGRKFPFPYYNMPRSWDSNIPLNAFFDNADEFLSFCGENYSGKNFMKNVSFTLENEKYRDKLLLRRYKTLTALLAHDFSCDIKSDKTIIYGAGAIGKELYKKIKNLTSVICFIDKKKKEKEFEGVPIVRVEDVKSEEGVKVIVSAAYDFQNIKEGLMDKFQNEDIISLDDILDLIF